jgi:hypothetical protein
LKVKMNNSHVPEMETGAAATLASRLSRSEAGTRRLREAGLLNSK